MALPPRDQRHQYLRFEGLEYSNADIADFEERLWMIYGRGVHQVQVFDFKGLTVEMAEGLSGRILMGIVLRDRVCLLIELEGSYLRAIQFQLGGARRRMRWREFILVIKDLMLRPCHRFIACTIAEMSQAFEKVTATDLFYHRGMDVNSVNIPYLLARYLRRFASRRKRDLGLERQPDAVAGALKVAEGAFDVDEGAQVVPAHVQAPQPLLAAAQGRTMPQRIARLEEEFYGLQGSMAEQRDVLDSMAHDFLGLLHGQYLVYH
nr:hypothetical protein [Tanacetum cinerariifolium]